MANASNPASNSISSYPSLHSLRRGLSNISNHGQVWHTYGKDISARQRTLQAEAEARNCHCATCYEAVAGETRIADKSLALYTRHFGLSRYLSFWSYCRNETCTLPLQESSTIILWLLSSIELLTSKGTTGSGTFRSAEAV